MSAELLAGVGVPLCAAATAVIVTVNLSPRIRLNNLFSLLASAVNWGAGLLMTAFIGLLSVQGLLGAGYDSAGGTGVGICNSVNKVPGIRAANVTDPDFARLAREHNDANVATLSGRFVDLDTNKAILDVFLSTGFEGGRHQNRVDKIMALD